MAAVEDPWQDTPDDQKTLESVLPKIETPETQEAPDLGMNNIEEAKEEATAYAVEKEKDGLRPSVYDIIESNEPERLLMAVEDLRMEGKQNRVNLILSVLGEIAKENIALDGNDFAQTAQRTIDQIKTGNAAHAALEAIMPEGQFNKSKLFDQLYTLTETPQGAEPIAKLFGLFQEMGNTEAMQEMMGMLNTLKTHATEAHSEVRAEAALLALDRIQVFGSENPDYQQIATNAPSDSPEAVAMLEAKLQEPSSVPVAESEEQVQAEEAQAETSVQPSETEAEKLARRESFKRANEGVENEFDEEIKLAEARADEMVESGNFDPNMSFNEITATKEAYKNRRDAIASAQIAEEAARIKNSETKASAISSNDDKFRNFLGLKEEAPVIAMKDEKPKNPISVVEKKPETSVKPEDAVIDKTPPKSETRVSRPAQPEAVKPETASGIDSNAGKGTTRVEEVNPNLVVKDYGKAAETKPKGNITVKKNADDPLDGL